MTRRLIVILGCHRGGTSTIGGCLYEMGVAMGGPLLPPGPDNPKGYFEHQAVVLLHDRWLAESGSHWSDVGRDWSSLDEATVESRIEELATLLNEIVGANELFAIKDPRIVRFLEIWEQALRLADIDPIWLLVRRHPWPVMASLIDRDAMSKMHAESIWARSMREAAEFASRHRHVVIGYEALVETPAAVLTQLVAQLRLGVDERRVEKAASFVEPRLNHHRDDPAWQLGEGSAELSQMLDELPACGVMPESYTRRLIALAAAFREARDIGETTAAVLCAQLFYAGPDATISEKNSAMKAVRPLIAEKLLWNLPEGQWNQLRFDPVNRMGAVLFTELKIHLAHGAEVDALKGRWLKLDSRGYLRVTATGLVIVSNEDDCRCSINLPPGHSVRQLSVVMTTIPTAGRLVLDVNERGIGLRANPLMLQQLLSPLRLRHAEALLGRLVDERDTAVAGHRSLIDADLPGAIRTASYEVSAKVEGEVAFVAQLIRNLLDNQADARRDEISFRRDLELLRSECARRQEESESLTRSLAVAEEARRGLERSVSSAIEERRIFSDRLTNVESMNALRAVELASVRSEYDVLRGRYDQAVEAISLARQQLSEERAERAAVDGLLQGARATAVARQAELERTAAEAHSQKAKLDALGLEVARLSERCGIEVEGKMALANQLQELTENIRSTNAAIESVQAEWMSWMEVALRTDASVRAYYTGRSGYAIGSMLMGLRRLLGMSHRADPPDLPAIPRRFVGNGPIITGGEFQK